MKDSESEQSWYSQVADAYTSQQRKSWYGAVADAYNRVRPRYSQELVGRVLELAQVPQDAVILEIGCGPGTATTSFAQLGLEMVCLEPNQEACQLARLNCAQYPNVEIKNTSFEEWDLLPQQFNIVLAATSFHWVSPEIGYPKVINALKDDGSLILLWNTALQPQYEVFQILKEVYQTYALSLAKYEHRVTQEESIKKFGQTVVNSGYFKDLVYEQLASELTYSIDDYLALLSTYSPYIMLEPQQRNSLFQALKEVLERNCLGRVSLSYLSAFHIAQKSR
ncbi:MAG: class I SAM-dependent methyltransferase [Symploca sp. SIO1C4]|uniref:Class I SAM-dependent methyltransferase n=1 Tax=Symploca sp. SIO1C4 TaxID=2607765 RepID=A0A6B3NCK9_9CYAN|nr:class I SAM-dependent methyltransferase [Symploca sp. SIO1C4]